MVADETSGQVVSMAGFRRLVLASAVVAAGCVTFILVGLTQPERFGSTSRFFAPLLATVVVIAALIARAIRPLVDDEDSKSWARVGAELLRDLLAVFGAVHLLAGLL